MKIKVLLLHFLYKDYLKSKNLISKKSKKKSENKKKRSEKQSKSKER